MERAFVNVRYDENLEKDNMVILNISDELFDVIGNSDELIENPNNYLRIVRENIVKSHPNMKDEIMYIRLGEITSAFPEGIVDDMDPVEVDLKFKYIENHSDYYPNSDV